MPVEGREGDSTTEELVLIEGQPELLVILPTAPKFWAIGPSGEVMGHRLAVSERAWGRYLLCR